MTRGSHGTNQDRETDEWGLPIPDVPHPERFSVRDYREGEYAQAASLDEAIAIRGQKAFFENLAPEDFGAIECNGVVRIGIAELWAQSTWAPSSGRIRNVAAERVLAKVSEGDVLVVAGIPSHLQDDENWEEIQELGYGFWGDGLLLPYTPFHDYDQNFFRDAIIESEAGDRLVCVVRNASCVGEDGIEKDPDFRWRVYSCKVTVYRIRSRTSGRA